MRWGAFGVALLVLLMACGPGQTTVVVAAVVPTRPVPTRPTAIRSLPTIEGDLPVEIARVVYLSGEEPVACTVTDVTEQTLHALGCRRIFVHRIEGKERINFSPFRCSLSTPHASLFTGDALRVTPHPLLLRTRP